VILSIIEKTKNDILLKCSAYNEQIINTELDKIIDSEIYVLAEDLSNLLFSFNISEETIRSNITNEIKEKIIKKIKRKLFVDSLALQVTNEYFIENFYSKKIEIEEVNKDYICEYNKNKDSNQLNLDEDINLGDVYSSLNRYIDINIISIVKENEFIVAEIKKLIDESKEKIKSKIDKLIKDCDIKYLEILINELDKDKERVSSMNEKDFDFEVKKLEDINDMNIFGSTEEIKSEDIDIDKILSNGKEKKDTSAFDKYDDMTLYNKVVLSLNTKEEKLSRVEEELKQTKGEIDKKLEKVNELIEKNLDKQELLSKLEMQLKEKELELNNKLAEADVIFLNMMPLIKSLNDMQNKSESVEEEKRGDSDE